jgi:hypothetical protein
VFQQVSIDGEQNHFLIQNIVQSTFFLLGSLIVPISIAINARLSLGTQSKTMYHDHTSPLSINTSRDVGPSGNAKTNGRCRSYQ